MSPTRKGILLTISIVMIVIGAWILHGQIMVSLNHGKFVLAGPAMIAVGIALIWEDFVAPILKHVSGRAQSSGREGRTRAKASRQR